MKRTISIKLITTSEQSVKLHKLQQIFNETCNNVAKIARDHRCWNKVDLHRLAYYQIRLNQTDETTKIGSQMVCNAIQTVCEAYKALKIKKLDEVPLISFRLNASVHYDKRTYTLKDNGIALYTLSGRILVPLNLGNFQKQYLQQGEPKEAELIFKKGHWYFNLVLDLPDATPHKPTGKVLGVDLGENNLAAISSGKLFGGGELRHKRDCALSLRGRLQSNGTKSSKQLLKKISGKESLHMKHVNHCISKQIINQAIVNECDTIALESLTNIRKNIKAGRRVRSRLHRWTWAQLQQFIVYKAQSAGIKIIFVHPAYTSQACSTCGTIGIRQKHRFTCKICGIQRHSDLNASQNIRRIAVSADAATGTVSCPNVATA